MFNLTVDKFILCSYSLVCISENCVWHFWSSSLNESRMFKFYVVHTCLLKNKIYTQRQATTNVVGSVFMDKCSDPKMIYVPKNIILNMKKDYGVTLTYI